MQTKRKNKCKDKREIGPIVIKNKTNIEWIIVSIFEIFFSIFMVLSAIRYDIYIFILIGILFAALSFLKIRNLPHDEYLVINENEIQIMKKNELDVYEWGEIDFLQFEECFSRHGKLGLTLEIHYRKYDFPIPIWFSDFDIEEENFKKLCEAYSGRKLFLDNYQSVNCHKSHKKINNIKGS